MTKRAVRVALFALCLVIWAVTGFLMVWTFRMPDPVWSLKVIGLASWLIWTVALILALYYAVTRLWSVTEKHREAIKDWYADLPERKKR